MKKVFTFLLISLVLAFLWAIICSSPTIGAAAFIIMFFGLTLNYSGGER